MRSKFLRLPGLLLLCTSLIFISSCQRELHAPDNGSVPTPVNDNEMVTGGITGIVIDESDRPVYGASVSSGSYTTTTDKYGMFKFRNINLSKENGSVKVMVPGYFTAYRTFYSVAGRINNVRIKLIPKTNSGNFSGAAGGTITISGGGKLVVPANAITDASGNAYAGMVSVAMTWIDPSSADLPNLVMGDLRGITTGGLEQGLSTYGMIGVEMTDGSGQKLKIATGNTAELTFPVPAALQTSAPATIDLWHFDEATARWKQEGTATKTGSNYVAQVSHFSFWNCDASFPLINLCMSFRDGNNQPLINTMIRIKRVVNNTYGYGWTDSTGNLCGKVPRDEALVLEVMDQCNQPVYSQNIGPFSANTTLPTVTVNVPAPNTLVISGTLTNCAGGNVTNGAVIVYTANAHYYVVPVTNGSFSVTIVRCSSGPITFTVLGVDYATIQQSAPFTGTATTGTINIGTIQACGTSSAEFVDFLVDGTPYTYIDPPDSLQCNSQPLTGMPYSTSTNIWAIKSNGGSTMYSYFNYYHNGVAAPNLLLTASSLTLSPGVSSQTIVTPNPTINITTFGPPITGFVEGNYNVQMDFSGTIRNVACTFRVRRNN